MMPSIPPPRHAAPDLHRPSQRGDMARALSRFWQTGHRRHGERSAAQIGSSKTAPGSYFVHDDRWHGLTHGLDQKPINTRALAQRVWVNVGEVRISD